MLSEALSYLAKGKSVMPIGRNKMPLVKWEELQTRLPTEEEVTAWWTQWPTANIGVITGQISNLTVIDVDVKSGGLETLKTLRLPMTLLVKTGGGGWHFYYKYTPLLKTGAGIFKGIDIRNDGGYVVAPPSIHENGQSYYWSSIEEPVDAPTNLFPNKEQTNWADVLNGVGSGSRNQSATKIFGKLFRAFKPEDWPVVVWGIVCKWNQGNQPPLEEAELRRTYTSISKLAIADKYQEIEKIEEAEEKKKDFKFLTFTEVVEMGYQELIKTQPEQIISYGYSWLDDKLVGIFPSELNVLGGESGTGKTALATNIIYRASKKVKCGVYALEDRLPDYGIKALFYEVNRIKKANEGAGAKGYWWNDYRLNRIKDSSFQTYLLKAKENLKNGNIFFAKVEEMMNIDLLESLILEQVKNGVKLFLIDHLHYFDLSSGTDSKSDYVEKIMVRLKTLLIKTEASMILVVHYKKLEGKKPSIDSFKDSIAIPQNANYVINLWRERSSDKAEEIEQLGVNLMPVQKKNITHFMIPKVRNPNGEGTYKAIWNPEKGDYEDEKREWQSGTDLQAIAKLFGSEITNLPNF